MGIIGEAVEEYVPGWRFYAVFATLLVASVSLGLYAASRFEWREVGGPAVWLWLSTALVTGLIVPELLQYAFLRRFGARPRRVGWIERNSGLILAWWRAPDHWLTGTRFAICYGAPVLLSCLVLTAYAAASPTAAPVVVLILPFYLGDLWCAVVVLRKPAGTLAQSFERGVRFRVPAARASSA